MVEYNSDKMDQSGLSERELARIPQTLAQYVNKGELAGVVTMIAHHGTIIHTTVLGVKDLISGAPMTLDTMFRIFSLTKPVTGVAMMILHDEGLWRPEDSIAAHLPEFSQIRVLAEAGKAELPALVDVICPPTMGQLMTHTAGFSYGLDRKCYIDRLYRAAEVWSAPSLAEMSKRMASLPLAYQPGSRWHYSLATDLQGAFIEKVSGQSLPSFMQERIFEPLGMTDTAFHTPPEKGHRLATLYGVSPNRGLVVLHDGPATSVKPPDLPSAGGGLVSTVDDYARFCQMLLNRGELDGVRIVSEAAIAYQMSNWISNDILSAGFGAGQQRLRPGFGYGFNGGVFTDPHLAGARVGAGTYQWEGAAGSWFWVDPTNDLLFIGLVHRLAANHLPLQAMMQDIVANALGCSGSPDPLWMPAIEISI